MWIPILFLFMLNHGPMEALSKYPKVLIISMDAFKPDYVDECLTPTIIRLRSSGVYAPYVKNVFPTKTLPNHHSIATGVHPDVHGVLDSTVYASKDGCSNHSLIRYSYELYHYNNDILPIWTLNQLAGKGRHSGVMMWPGGEYSYGCKKTVPTFSQRWDMNVSFQRRVDTVMTWFLHEKTPANLVMLYLEEPDLHGHAFGINSPEVRELIKKLDKTLDYIYVQLKTYNLEDQVTVFAVSDHGMIDLNQRNIIDLNKYVDNSTYVRAGYSPVLQIFPNEGVGEKVLAAFKKAQQAYRNNLDVYTRNEIPSIWQYSANNRTPPILVVAKEGYAFQDFYRNIEELDKKFDIEPNPRNKYGIHGYSNTLPSMHPLFFAWGPLVKSGLVLDPFNTTDLYSLWAYVLNLELEHEIYSLPNLTMLINAASTDHLNSPVNNQSDIKLYGPSNRSQPSVPHLGKLPLQSAPSWTYWFSGLIALTLLMIITGVIVHFCRDLHHRSLTAAPTIPHHTRSFVENQHLLVSESEDEFRL